MSVTDQLDSHTLKVGDRIVLKSGGPVMTIVKITDTTVEAMWFDDEAAIDSCEFPTAAVKEVG